MTQLSIAIGGLPSGTRTPGYAVVMAMGIISQAMRLDGAALLSAILLWAGIAAYVLLAAVHAVVPR